MATMKVAKRILFFILLPIYGPMYALMHYTFKWWESLLDD
jgi:hypothetical protein